MEKAKVQTRRVLTLRERVEVIRLAQSQQDAKELARIFDCGLTQIRAILQQKDRLLKEFINNGDPNRLRQRASPFGVAINKVVAEWVHRARAAQMPIDDSMITERAYQARKLFVFHDFRPNKRWLDRFKRRFRFDDVDLETPDPKLKIDKLQSLTLSDIYDDIKHTLDTSVNEVMAKRDATKNSDGNMSDSLVDQNASSNNDKSEAEDYDDLTCQMESFCEVEIKEEGDGNAESENAGDSMEDQNTCSDNERSEGADYDELTRKLESSKEDDGGDAIKTNEQALECIKRLEEYSMLKGNYRAIGLIIQLEQLYKGQIEE